MALVCALGAAGSHAAAFDGILRTTNPSDVADANAYLATGNVTLTIDLTDTSWTSHTIALTGFVTSDTINIVRSGAPLSGISSTSSYPNSSSNSYYSFPDDYLDDITQTLSGGVLTLGRHYVHYIALGPLTYNDDTYSLVLSGLTGVVAANIVYDQAPVNVVPIATGVGVTGTAKVGMLLSGNYTYDDGENDAQGTSTFKWYADTASSGNTKQFLAGATGSTYTPVSANYGKYLFFCVTPVATSGTSPGHETCSLATGAVGANAPDAPLAPTAVAGNAQAGLRWSAPGNNGGSAVTGYRVQMATAPAGPFADATGGCAPTATSGTTATACTVTGLTNGTFYFFKVLAINVAGAGTASAASDGVLPTAPPAMATLAPPPVLPGVATRPSVLDLGSNQGPALTACLGETVRTTLGGGFNYLGQGPDGTARFGDGQAVLSFYPIGASSTVPQVQGVQPQSSNYLNVGTRCGSLSVVPAMYNLSEFAALLSRLGFSANINAQGVFTVAAGSAVYVFRPDYVATPGAASGAASLVVGKDGVFRFTDSAGFVQVLQPAFVDPEVLSIVVMRNFSGSAQIQADGTALVSLPGGAQFVLTPDLTLGDIPQQFSAAEWWQAGASTYRYRVASFPNASQGLRLTPKP